MRYSATEFVEKLTAYVEALDDPDELIEVAEKLFPESSVRFDTNTEEFVMVD